MKSGFAEDIAVATRGQTNKQTLATTEDLQYPKHDRRSNVLNSSCSVLVFCYIH